jgi:hypothetical protein
VTLRKSGHERIGQTVNRRNRGRGRLVDRRSPREIRFANSLVHRNVGNQGKTVLGGKLANGRSVLFVSRLVRDADDPRNTYFSSELGASPRRLERLIVRLESHEQRVDVAAGAATEMLQAGLHVHDGRGRFVFEKRSNDMPHLGMSSAESTGARVIDSSHQHHRHAVGRRDAELLRNLVGR